MTAEAVIPGRAGTIRLEAPAGRAGSGGFRRVTIERGGRRHLVLDLDGDDEAVAPARPPAQAVSPDGLYLMVYRSEGLGRGSDGGPARQSFAVVGVEEEGFVDFEDSNRLSVSTDTIVKGWDTRYPHLLVVERNKRPYPALPAGEAMPAGR